MKITDARLLAALNAYGPRFATDNLSDYAEEHQADMRNALEAALTEDDTEWEWNVARFDPQTGEVWDVFPDEALDSLGDAIEAQREWEEEVDGDPVVIIRRRKFTEPEWERVETKP